MTRIMAALVLVILVLSNLVGCGDQVLKVDFSAKPTTGYAPLKVEFTDLSKGNIIISEWDFNGDGVVDSIGKGPLLFSTYNNPGNYTVRLTAIDPNSNDTEVKTDYIKVILPPRCPTNIADFIAEPTSGEVFTTVHFTDTSEGDVTAWAWDFQSDGFIDSNEQNPTYIYNTNGNYSVTLTIATTKCQDTLTKSDYISITECHC